MTSRRGIIAVGDIRVASVLDGVVRLDATYFGGISPELSPKLINWRGGLRLPVGCFLIAHRGSYTLVDGGVGPVDLGWARGGRLMQGLARLGVASNEITNVVVTHLHLDHCGWLVVDERLMFPRAVVHIGAEDVEWARTHSPRAWGIVEFLDANKRLNAVGRGYRSVVPGIVMQPAPGHTPGHHMVRLQSRGERVLILGDLAVTPLQLGDPTLVNRADADPRIARRTRQLLVRGLTPSTLLTGSHFPQLRFGRLRFESPHGPSTFEAVDGGLDGRESVAMSMARGHLVPHIVAGGPRFR